MIGVRPSDGRARFSACHSAAVLGMVGVLMALGGSTAVAEIQPGTARAVEDALGQGMCSIDQVPAHDRRLGSDDSPPRTPQFDEEGDLLIIAFDSWIPNVEPLAAHKDSIGISTTIVGVSTIGSDAAAIRSYIQNVYETGDLAFVLLVGDVQHVPTFYAGGNVSDPSYAKVAGGDDYADILVGRFSAATADDVGTQVLRTIEYEANCATQQDWFWRGAGIGSDAAQLDDIRDALLAHGYTHVDQLYDPGVTSTMILDALNDGRGIINYIGHAWSTCWGTGPFCVGDVAALVNDNTLPFVISSAVLNGAFNVDECLAEAWLRGRHGPEPTGAIAAFMASGRLGYNEASVAHQEFISLYINGTYGTFGALCFGATSRLINEYGYAGVEAFDMWNVFGDPSLRVVGTVAKPTSSDFDGDGDVDLTDAHFFQVCFGEEPVSCDCATFDFDHNGAIDAADYLEFFAELNGP